MARKTFIATEVLSADNVNNFLYNRPDVVTSAATSYSATTADINKILQFTSASNVTLTLSSATALQAGEFFDVLRDGAGTVTITAGPGMTVLGRGTAASNYAIGTQYDMAAVVCIATNSYRVIGNVTAS